MPLAVMCTTAADDVAAASDSAVADDLGASGGRLGFQAEAYAATITQTVGPS